MQMSGTTSEMATAEGARNRITDTEHAMHDTKPRAALPKLPTIPDLNNHRFCRACQAMLPVEFFPAGTRRYLCRRHLWERVQLPSKKRMLSDTRKKLLWLLWKRCWTDAKDIFGQPRVAVMQKDIEQILSERHLATESHQAAARSGASRALNRIALMPINPGRLLSHDNVVVVDSAIRRSLLRACRKGGCVTYMKALADLTRDS